MKIAILCFLLHTLFACSSFVPTDLDYAELAVADKKSPIKYAVYTPPNWTAEERLPLVLFLHGVRDSETSFEQYGANDYLDQMMNEGKIKRAIVVFPNGDRGFWENWADGSYRYRDWVLKDVMPKVQEEYNTLTCPEHCHLAGISMGGFGVLRIASLAKHQFSSVSAISAPIFSDAQVREKRDSLLIRFIIPIDRIFGPSSGESYKKDNPYNSWVDDSEQRKLRLQLMWGDEDKDRIIELNQIFHQRLLANDVQHDHYVYQGGHKWVDWVPNLDRVFNFLLSPAK